MTEQIPKYVLDNIGVKTQREFKSLKRQEFKRVQKALREFSAACYFCPDYHQIGDLLKRADEIEQSISVKNWGR